MEQNNCPICLESLFTPAAPRLGVATPCGHCFHRSCFQKWATASTHQSLRITSGTEIRPKCPTCNTLVDNFVEIYLNSTTNVTNSVDGLSTTVDLIDVSNGEVAEVGELSLRNQQHATMQLKRMYSQEIMTLRVNVSTLEDDLKKSKTLVRRLRSKEGSMQEQLKATISENDQKQVEILELQSKVKRADIEKKKAIIQATEAEKEYEIMLKRAEIKSMSEVKEIIERNQKNSQKYDSLVKYVRSKELEVEKLLKENAHMKKLMMRRDDIKLESGERKGKIGKSLSMVAKSYASARRQVELEQEADAKEAMAARKRTQTRAMMTSSSTQASRLFKAARVNSNIHRKSAIQVSRSITINPQITSVHYHDEKTATPDKRIFRLDDCNRSYIKGNNDRSVNTMLAGKKPARHPKQRNLLRKKDEQSSQSITKYFSC